MYAPASPRRPPGVPPVSPRFCVAGVGQCALPRGRMYPPVSLRCPLFLRGRRGTMCTAKGSDVRPGVPPVSLCFRRFCVAGLEQCTLPRGRMYAPVSLRCPSGPASFAWDNEDCQGVGCTLRCPSGVPPVSLRSPPLLRGRCGIKCSAKGSDVRPGVPPVSLGLRRFYMVGTE